MRKKSTIIWYQVTPEWWRMKRTTKKIINIYLSKAIKQKGISITVMTEMIIASVTFCVVFGSGLFALKIILLKLNCLNCFFRKCTVYSKRYSITLTKGLASEACEATLDNFQLNCINQDLPNKSQIQKRKSSNRNKYDIFEYDISNVRFNPIIPRASMNTRPYFQANPINGNQNQTMISPYILSFDKRFQINNIQSTECNVKSEDATRRIFNDLINKFCKSTISLKVFFCWVILENSISNI